MISVVIPTCRRAEFLKRCLNGFAPEVQGVDGKIYEVIVTDDGGDVNVKGLLSGEYPWVRWVQGPRKGPAANRNNGARYARGEWIAFTDDDCIPGQSWIKEICLAAERESPDVIEGKTVVPGKKDDLFWHGVENTGGGVYWSCNLTVRKETFQLMGGFDEDFLAAGGEDMEFASRIKKAGIKTVFAEKAIVLHPVRKDTVTGLFRGTFGLRWKQLYKFKTGQSLPLSANMVSVLGQLAATCSADLLRTTWHLFSKRKQRRGKTWIFEQVWRWITFPLVLPYLMVWETRFRARIKKRMKG